LVCHRYGELSPQSEKTVSRHLKACETCRVEFQRLSAALDMPAPPTSADDVGGLLSRLRTWESGESQPQRNSEALKRRVAGSIEPYLGKAAADALLQPVREDGRNLLSNVAPVLAVFLGRRAAGNLVSCVVETAIVRF
jgi:anti-sigma factor RsiW